MEQDPVLDRRISRPKKGGIYSFIDTIMKILFLGEEVEVIKIECDEVICDKCDTDYTERCDTGGAISGGRAYCPRCWTGTVREYGMPKAQTIINNPRTPFAGFVKAIRARSAV